MSTCMFDASGDTLEIKFVYQSCSNIRIEKTSRIPNINTIRVQFLQNIYLIR